MLSAAEQRRLAERRKPLRLNDMNCTATPPCQANTGRPGGHTCAPLEGELLAAATTGKDVRAGLTEVVAILRQSSDVTGVEWWSRTVEKAVFRLVLWDGAAIGPRTAVPIGAAGTLVLVGDVTARLVSAVSRLGSVLHHRSIAEQLADEAERLARQNEALDDLVALVAHDVRSSLLSAGTGDDQGENKLPALELVDSILEAVRADRSDRGVASVAECVRQAEADLGPSPRTSSRAWVGRSRCRTQPSGWCCATCWETRWPLVPGEFTSGLVLWAIAPCWSSTTMAPGWERRKATPPVLSSVSLCAVA